MDLIKVTAMTKGFRRAGRPWNGSTIVPTELFDEAQLEALKNEPRLVVSEPSDNEAEAFVAAMDKAMGDKKEEFNMAFVESANSIMQSEAKQEAAEEQKEAAKTTKKKTSKKS